MDNFSGSHACMADLLDVVGIEPLPRLPRMDANMPAVQHHLDQLSKNPPNSRFFLRPSGNTFYESAESCPLWQGSRSSANIRGARYEEIENRRCGVCHYRARYWFS